MSLSINIASVLTCHLSHLSVCVSIGCSVCLPESVFWQNDWVDPDTIWDGKWGQSMDGCIRWVVIVEEKGEVLGVNLGLPIVTNGTMLHCCVEVHEPLSCCLGWWLWSAQALVYYMRLTCCKRKGQFCGVLATICFSGFQWHIYKHRTILRLFGFFPEQPGWASTRRNIHHSHPSWSSIIPICFLHLLQSMASSLFNPRTVQSFSTISL